MRCFIKGFENTSEFSRRYQSTQNCICDTEHMFNCPNQSAGDAAEAPSSHMAEHDDVSYTKNIKWANLDIFWYQIWLLYAQQIPIKTDV